MNETMPDTPHKEVQKNDAVQAHVDTPQKGNSFLPAAVLTALTTMGLYGAFTSSAEARTETFVPLNPVHTPVPTQGKQSLDGGLAIQHGLEHVFHLTGETFQSIGSVCDDIREKIAAAQAKAHVDSAPSEKHPVAAPKGKLFVDMADEMAPTFEYTPPEAVRIQEKKEQIMANRRHWSGEERSGLFLFDALNRLQDLITSPFKK